MPTDWRDLYKGDGDEGVEEVCCDLRADDLMYSMGMAFFSKEAVLHYQTFLHKDQTPEFNKLAVYDWCKMAGGGRAYAGPKKMDDCLELVQNDAECYTGSEKGGCLLSQVPNGTRTMSPLFPYAAPCSYCQYWLDQIGFFPSDGNRY